jgi:hypothetical protein
MLVLNKITTMKTLFIFIGSLFISLAGFPQEQSDQQMMTKKEQKQLAKEYRESVRQAEEKKNVKLTDSLMNQHRFVLEADYISGTSGQRYLVSSNLNFISIDSSEAVLQLGSNTGFGYNGVGGITVEGNITKYKMTKKEGKKGSSYNVTLFIMSNLGTYDIQLWVSSSGQADATVRGNTSGSLTYSGRIVPINESRVYKARSI